MKQLMPLKQTDEEIYKMYGRAPEIEVFTPSSIADYARTTVRSGLVWDMAMLYVTLNDSKGQKYTLNRGWEKTMSGLWLSSKLDPDLSKASPRIFKRQFTGSISFDVDHEEQKIKIRSWPSKHNFRIDIEVGKIHWEEENGAVNLDLKPVGPGFLHSDLDELDGFEGMEVTCEVFEVTGTINGEKVTGYGGLDNTWLVPGVGFSQCKIYTHIQTMWSVWATRYDDGSLEYGAFGTGPGNWRWGFYVEDGKPMVGQEFTIDAKWGEADGVKVPVEVDFKYGDHDFKWNPNGRLSLLKGNLNRVSGEMINTRRTAKPVETFSWIEFRQPVV